jgi:hypothetical protein
MTLATPSAARAQVDLLEEVANWQSQTTLAWVYPDTTGAVAHAEQMDMDIPKVIGVNPFPSGLHQFVLCQV